MYDQKAVIINTGLRPGTNFGLSFSLADAVSKFDIAFQPDKAYTVSKVAFKVASITGSPTCTLRIETDSSGRPSGTLAWPSATVTGVVLAAGWTTEIALTASGTLSTGTLYHLVISNDAASPATNSFTVQDQSGIDGLQSPLIETQWTASFNGTTWSNRNGPIYMLSDGTNRFGQPFDNGPNVQTLNSTTGYGVKFTAPFAGSLAGLMLSHLLNTGMGTLTAKLYSSTDTLLGTATISGASLFAVSGVSRTTTFMPFDSQPVTIAAGSSYRLVIFDSGSADRLEWSSAPSTPTDYRTVYPTTQDAQWTQGSVGSWTDTPGKLPAALMVMASAITAGGGGGGNLLGNGTLVIA